MNKTEFLINIEKFEKCLSYLSLVSQIPQMDRDDVRQEILLKLWVAKDGFDSNKANFNTWAVAVAKNRIKDLVRYYWRDKRKSINYYVPLDVYVEQIEKQGFHIEDLEEQEEVESKFVIV